MVGFRAPKYISVVSHLWAAILWLPVSCLSLRLGFSGVLFVQSFSVPSDERVIGVHRFQGLKSRSVLQRGVPVNPLFVVQFYQYVLISPGLC